MAQKRDKFKEGIFVTNEYFEKAGITRQVVSLGIEKGKIKPAGSFVIKSVMDSIIQEQEIKSIFSLKSSPYIYYRQDADFYILSYWTNNYKRYLRAVCQTWEELKKQDAFKNFNEQESKDLLLELLEGNGQSFLFPSYIIEFKKIVSKYYNFSNGHPLEDDPFFEEFSRGYMEGISKRNKRFAQSGKSIEAFLRREYKKKYERKLKEMKSKEESR